LLQNVTGSQRFSGKQENRPMPPIQTKKCFYITTVYESKLLAIKGASDSGICEYGTGKNVEGRSHGPV